MFLLLKPSIYFGLYVAQKCIFQKYEQLKNYVYLRVQLSTIISNLYITIKMHLNYNVCETDSLAKTLGTYTYIKHQSPSFSSYSIKINIEKPFARLRCEKLKSTVITLL